MTMEEDAIIDGLLAKLRPLSQKPNENTDLIRSLTSKLHTRLTGQDMHVRQSTLDNIWKSNPGDISVLITIIESSRDASVCNNIIAILREVICLKPGRGKHLKAQRKLIEQKQVLETNGDKTQDNGNSIKPLNISKKIMLNSQEKSIVMSMKKANNLARQAAINHTIQKNSTFVLLKILVQTIARKEPTCMNTEVFLYDLLWVLSQLSQKDSGFSVKARTLGGVKIIHSLLKLNMTNNKILFPLLNLMKQFSKHPVTTAILLRDGVISTYEKVLISLGFMPTVRMRLCLDTISYFSRNKNCCIQLVKAGIIHIFMRIFDRWDKFEGRMKIKLCSHILQTLQHVSIIKSGRRTISLKKHIQILHRFCMSCPDEDIFDRLFDRVCSLICMCLSNKHLPIPPTNPAVFRLSNVLKDDLLDQANQNSSEYVDSSSEEEVDNDDQSLSKDDSEASSDSDNLKDTSIGKRSQDSCDASPQNHVNFISQSSIREIDDLKRYNQFFKEYSRLQKQLKLIKSYVRNNNIAEEIGSTSSSYLNIDKIEHSTLLKNSLVTSTPSLIFNMETEKYLNNQQIVNNQNNSTENVCNLKVLQNMSFNTFYDAYTSIASNVKSIIPFVKIPYPNLHGSEAFCEPEYLNKVERLTYRKKMITCVERAIDSYPSVNEVAYDLDLLYKEDCSKSQDIFKMLENTDEQRLHCRNFQHKRLEFESRFESGNLRKAILVGSREYDLILMPDVNSNRRHFWFYFEVSNMTSGLSYIFNIINCEKFDSQFNFGMKPVMYSVKEAALGRPGWVRVGTDICYYRNSYPCFRNKVPSKCYHTVTFTVDFPHSNDVCYLAYHFPYTYSQMMAKIWKWSNNLPANIYFRAESLCQSLNYNEIPLITITAAETIDNPIQDRDVVFLTSRVHPGESNASWVMEGSLRCLLDKSALAEHLRQLYVFKIVPMLNVEGVINGCSRCGLTNEDLNRRWSNPCPIIHPGIYHTKGLLEYMCRALKKPPLVYCDFHGHSRKKNVFLYGCSPTQSWCSKDKEMTDPEKPLDYLCLPAAVQKCCPAFSLSSCSFRVERERESTARVSVWRQLGIRLSYTLETSFCGFDQGPYKGLQLNTRHLKDIGKDLCTALAVLKETSPNELYITTDENGKSKETDSDVSSGNSSSSVSETDDEVDQI